MAPRPPRAFPAKRKRRRNATRLVATVLHFMLRRKTIIVLTITLVVTLMVSAFSYLYISQTLRLRIDNANETAQQLTRQLAYAAENDPPDLSSTRIDTNNPVAVRRAMVEY